MASAATVGTLACLCWLVPLCLGGCMFQEPFYFTSAPKINAILDSRGRPVADKVRLSWGQMLNFKCVDYFQVQWYDPYNVADTFMTTGKIGRHTRDFVIDVKPCKDYAFRVIASEDWQGTRPDYKVTSDEASFRVDYTPKFLRPPLIKERRILVTDEGAGDHHYEKRSIFGKKKRTTTTTTTTTTTEPPYYLWITFQLTDIDWPSCINYIEFDYYDTVYNESVYMETVSSPLPDVVEIQIVNKNVPCGEDFAHFTRVYGATGDSSQGYWTPPSCVTTTPAPTTPGSTTTTTVADTGALYRAQSENWELKEQISLLRYEYGNIGKQVYDALKDGAYHQFKAYVAKKAVIATGDVYKIKLIHENRFDHDYALNNLLDDLEPHME